MGTSHEQGTIMALDTETRYLISYTVMSRDPSEPLGGLPRNMITQLKPVEWLACMGKAAAGGYFRELGESFWIAAVWLTGVYEFRLDHLVNRDLIVDTANVDLILFGYLTPPHPYAYEGGPHANLPRMPPD